MSIVDQASFENVKKCVHLMRLKTTGNKARKSKENSTEEVCGKQRYTSLTILHDMILSSWNFHKSYFYTGRNLDTTPDQATDVGLGWFPNSSKYY
jgi:hypothetical protein